MTTKTVHFTVDPAWATDFVRERWSEGEYLWCFEFLSGCGVDSKDIQRDIIMGKSKFINSDEPDSFFLADDNWTPVVNSCHLCQYPDPKNYREMKAAYEKLSDRLAEQKASVLLAKIEENKYNPRFLPGEPRYENYLTFKPKSSLDTVDGFIQDTRMNDKIAEAEYKPTPEPVYENGIITPDGSFYRCGVMGHNILSVSLGYAELEYDEEGLDPSQKALKAGCILVSLTIVGKKVRRIDGTVTKEQRERLKEWIELISYSNAPLSQVDY